MSSLGGASEYTTTPIPGGCHDCPVPPDSSVEWLASAIELSILPLVGLAFGLLVAYAVGHQFVAFTRSKYGVATLVAVVVAGLVAFAVDAVVVSASAVAVAILLGLLLAISRGVGPSLPTVFDRPDVWIGGALAVIVGQQALAESIPEPTTMVVSLTVLALLSYPLGLATGRLPADRAHAEWAGVVLAMALAIVALMGALIPYPGGPAVLVLFGNAIFVFAVVLASSSLLALGEERTAAGE